MNEPQKGRVPSQEDIFYLQWGLESLKSNISLSNDILKQLIAISSALLGVSILFEEVIHMDWVRVLVLLSFLTSLVIAFLGVLPYESKVNPNSPSDIRKHKGQALKHKRLYLWISASCLMIGISAIIAEIIININ